MSGIKQGLVEGQGGLFSATVGAPQNARTPVGWNNLRPRANRTRCATRLYTTMLTNTTSATLAGYGFPGADTKLTHGLLADVEAPFDAVSLIVQNTTASVLTWGNAKVSSVRQVALAQGNIAETLNVTFNGASSVAVPAGSVTNPTFVVSDPAPLNSVARSDGGTRPLLLLTAETTTATDGSTQLGSWYRGVGDNTTKTHEGGRVLAAVTVVGSIAPSAMPMSAAGTDASSALVGFVYWARGVKVLTVMEAGNSLTAGNTLPTANRGHLIRAVEAVSSPEAPVEYMVAGLPGQSVEVIRALTEKILGQASATSGLLPGVVVFNPFDTNSNVGSAIVLGPMRAAAGRVEAAVNKLGAELILMEGLPRQASASASAWSNDEVRQEFNRGLSADYTSVVIPQARALQASGNPSLFAPGTVQGDFTHPTIAGDDLIKELLVETLSQI